MTKFDLELKHISTVGEKSYFISTIKMFVRHLLTSRRENINVYETMIFEKNDEKVLYHDPIYLKRYDLYEKAIEGHKKTIENIEEIINKHNNH